MFSPVGRQQGYFTVAWGTAPGMWKNLGFLAVGHIRRNHFPGGTGFQAIPNRS
jgi:hypothetical protein